MPHLPFVNVGNTIPYVTPISGNDEHGSALYDPTTGKALYAVYNDGDFEMHRTTGSARTLGLEDDSVEYLSTILTGPVNKSRDVALTRIGGTIYCSIVSMDIARDRAGQWIYRDTSAAGDGTGPWVQHGTVKETPSVSGGVDSESMRNNDLRWGGEIIVFDNGTWCIPHCWATYEFFGSDRLIHPRTGCSISTDNGVTWTSAIMLREGSGSAPSGPGYTASVFSIYGGTTSFGKDADGKWWCGWPTNNTGVSMQFHSTDGNWTRNNLDTSPPGAKVWPMSSSITDRIYTGVNSTLSYTDQPLLDLPSYTSSEMSFSSVYLSNKAIAMVCNIGPDATPNLIATNHGRVLQMSINTGWTVGHIGMA